MKRSYVKPELNASMNGTLEGVYAYACGPTWVPCQPDCKTSSNKEEYSCEDNYNDCSGIWFWFRFYIGRWF